MVENNNPDIPDKKGCQCPGIPDKKGEKHTIIILIILY